jgi:hypothetical protein
VLPACAACERAYLDAAAGEKLRRSGAVRPGSVDGTDAVAALHAGGRAVYVARPAGLIAWAVGSAPEQHAPACMALTSSC